jgi:murein DD-endopeptidase MepM/ murein hydrolase activator NlpD
MRMRLQVPALNAVFAAIFRLSADKEYLLHVQWQNKRRSISRPLSPALKRTLTGVLAFLMLGFLCLVGEAGYWAIKEIRYRVASTRHSIQIAELRDIQYGLKSIEGSVEDAFQQEQRMRALYGINYLGPSQSNFGVGGRTYPEPEDADLSRGLYENLFHAQLKGRQLRGKLDYTLRNFRQIQEFVDYRHELWDHTPSITPAPGNWTSEFGYRVHPVSGRYKMHTGLDISGTRWTPVHATANGRVSVSGAENGYGNLVVISHGNGYSTKYGHLNRILVKKGQVVKRFDLIGYMGNTGVATGVHVHYEVVQGKTPINPEKFILPTGLVVD